MNEPSKQLTPYAQIRSDLAQNVKRYDQYLKGTGTDGAKFAAMVMGQIDRQPDLLKCDQHSVMMGCALAAMMGLSFNSQDAHLLPFKGKATLIPGYGGLQKLALQSGFVTAINTRVVYASDEFDPDLDNFRYKMNMKRQPGEERIGAFSKATLRSGGYMLEVMLPWEIEQIRNKSQGAKSSYSPWNAPEETIQNEMWRKTVIRRLCKNLPKSPILTAAIEAENVAERGGDQKIVADTLIIEAERGGSQSQWQSESGLTDDDIPGGVRS